MNSKNIIKQIVKTEGKIKKLPALSKEERELIEAEISVDSVYHSNRLEGNELSKKDAKKAMLSSN